MRLDYIVIGLVSIGLIVGAIFWYNAQMDKAFTNGVNSVKIEYAQKEKEMNELAMVISGCALVLFLLFVGVNEMIDFCQTTHRCGGR